MVNTFKEIEVYNYATKNRTSIKIFNYDGSEYMSFAHNEIKSLKMNLKSGNFYFIGRIFGAPKELKLDAWKKNQNDLIKKVVVEIVQNGFAKCYIFNAGIQKLQEDYKTMSYLAVFKHDNIKLPLLHSVEMFDNELVLDIKIDKNNISFNNVSSATALNLGLSTIGFGIGVLGVASTGTITIPIVIALAIGGSSLVSASFDFTVEVLNNPKAKGQCDLLQQLTGEIGKKFGSLRGENINKSEENFENAYSMVVFFYGLLSGRDSLKTLFNTKSFTQVSKRFGNGYFNVKFVTLKNITNGSNVETAVRKFNKSLFINDATNTLGAGKSIYDKIPNR